MIMSHHQNIVLNAKFHLDISKQREVTNMVSEKTKGNFGAIVIMIFVMGIFLMIVDGGIGWIFGIGLLMFVFSLIIFLFVMIWSIAVSADNFTRRF